MSQREILTNGNAFKRTDGRWGGTVWYLDEKGERKRKSFSGTTKAEVNKKMKKYIVEFNEDKNDSVESLKTLKEGLQNWLQVFKFPAVERTTYDRAESIAKNQIYPRLGKKIVGDVTAADIKKLLNYWMTEGYAYTTVKKVYVLLNEYFRYLYQQEIIVRNPMANVEMINSCQPRAKKISLRRRPSRSFQRKKLKSSRRKHSVCSATAKENTSRRQPTFLC